MRPERIYNRLSSLGGKPSEQDRADSLELAVSARRFSRRTQAVIDDKLSFSATLMRAGEVEAANRLLAEVGEEVLTEEVALLERVNEVKAARSVGGRDRVTRGRLARTLAVAMLGSALFAFSAAGAAVVGMFRENDQAVHGSEPDTARVVTVASGDRVLGTRQVRVLDNVSLKMTAAQFREYSKLTTGEIDADELEIFLLDLLPPSLAEKVHLALVAGLEVLPAPVSEEIVAASDKLFEKKSTSTDERETQPETKETEEPKEAEPTPEPSPGDETPAPEGSPEESPEDNGGLPLFGGEEEKEGS